MEAAEFLRNVCSYLPDYVSLHFETKWLLYVTRALIMQNPEICVFRTVLTTNSTDRLRFVAET
jgi:hypothetical protein